MNERMFVDALDELPLGVLCVQDQHVVWMNRYTRDRISGDIPAYVSMCEARADLGTLTFGPMPSRVVQVLVGGSRHCAMVQGTSANRTITFVPIELAESLVPEFKQTQQSCRDFEEIFRNSFDGIFVADGDGTTLFVNEGCERNYGLKAKNLVGRPVAEFERKGWIRPVIAGKVAETGKRITTTQQTHEGKTIMVTGIPLFDEAGAVRRVIINSRDMTELVTLQQDLERAREDLRRVDDEVEALRSQVLQVSGVVLQSRAMQSLAALAMRVAKVDTTVLITGDSGVGKEVLTRLIHNESARSGGPFIKINCGALPRELLETELFGYEAGAFTGAQRQGKHGLMELASGGTLFLDEIGEVPLDVQVKLLTVLQDRALVRVGGTRTIPIDVRIVAATNRDLKQMVAQRAFRADLYYRLNVVPIHIPPLAERPEDILPLVHQFVGEFNRQYGFDRRLSERALGRLRDYAWPGNVRELRNVIERLVVTSPDALVGSSELDGVLPQAWDPTDSSDTFRFRVERYERSLLEEALRSHGTTRGVAKALGLSQSSVVRKLRAGTAV